jgi:zinc transporter ZupT
LGAGHRRVTARLLVDLAAGALLALALVHLLPEAAELSGWLLALLAGAAGVWLSVALVRRAGGVCPACTPGTPGTSPWIGAVYGPPLLLIMGFHSSLDGVALATAAGAHDSGEVVSLAILLHKLPEGLAIASVCRLSGRSILASIALTALVEGATLLGLALGLAVGTVAVPALGAGLGLVAGTFISLAALTWTSDRTGFDLRAGSAAALTGALVIVAARLATGH